MESQPYPGLHPKQPGQEGQESGFTPLLCSCETTPTVLCAVLCSQHRKDVELWEQGQRRAMKLLKALEHLPNEDMLREWDLSSLERKGLH